MQYKIDNLRVKNFKCFNDAKFYEFKFNSENSPVVLSGPNGFGKTTFFDAIELIFSKNITRLDKEIENKHTNLGKNILLNEANKDGYIVLTLKKTSDDILTLFAKISNNNHKLEIKNSVRYGKTNKFIPTEDLVEYLNKYEAWSDFIDNEELIRYRAKNFNVYYYISQAESVHFLKRSITDRKNAMNILLNTSFVEERKQIVLNLIGNRNGSSGYLINDEIIRLENELKKKAVKLKTLLNNIQDATEKVEPVYLGLYEKDANLYFWDCSNISEHNINAVKKAALTLKRLISFCENENDYRHYQWNNDITRILKGKSIEDFVTYKEYIINNSLSLQKVEEQIKKWDCTIQIYKSSKLFRGDIPDVADYNEEDIDILKRFVPELKEFDFSLINNLISEIFDLKRNLSVTQKRADKIINARNVLKNVKEEYYKDSPVCPFCNSEFSDVTLLEAGFDEANKMLQFKSGCLGRKLLTKTEALNREIKKVKLIIHPYVDNLDENVINLLIQKGITFKKFVSNSGRVTNAEKVAEYLENIDYDYKINLSDAVLEIQRILSKLVKNIDNKDFNDLNIKYEYEKVDALYGLEMNYIKGKISIEKMKEKLKYLEGVVLEKENIEIYDVKNEMKTLIVRKECLTKIRKRLYDLSKIYEKSVEEYKNITLKQLRVPLLIYTGKILQDYQNGLGVFVSRDEMRFVSNGDAKHDILNTFSSGQLSGFVLAFLFAMNKQYIKASADDIGFILIDDPVQTMDDINISSLVEVLRNDFSDKQIILSTHEMDKENYILYKFYKYNKLGQSFNVKERIYG